MDYESMLRQMVTEQIVARGIRSPSVIDAFTRVMRHEFVDIGDRDWAYGDHPLEIGAGQTISQPYIVALMTAALDLKPGDKVLEIGTGSGYQTAILAALGAPALQRVGPTGGAGGMVSGITKVTVDGKDVPVAGVTVELAGKVREANASLYVSYGAVLKIRVPGQLEAGEHTIQLTINAPELGQLTLPVTATI